MPKSPTKQIVNFLSLFPSDVTAALTPEHKEDAKYPDVLHISRDGNLKDMIPRISDRQNSKEDRTVPRVVGAPTLLGCIVGYQTILSDYRNFDKPEKRNKDWLNGYYIYDLDYEWRFAISNKLVSDSGHSDEMWLLAYSENSKVYKPKKIGKFFAVEDSAKFTTGPKGPISVSTIYFYVEVKSEKGIDLSAKHKLDKGFWKIGITYTDKIGFPSVGWKTDSDLIVEKIVPADYYVAKKLVANLLGYDNTNPYQF